jgi:hypothetical protein
VSYHENWLNMVREATAGGRLFSRVRVVTFPLTDYIRFTMWVAGYTRKAGDDIRYLTRDQAAVARLPAHDFWLFDSRKLVMMNFDEDARFVGADVIEDPSAIVEHNSGRDAARHHALTPDEFVATYEQRDVQRR